MVEKFYMVYPRKYVDDTIAFIEENNVPILTNAKDRWSDAKGEFLDMWEYDTERVIDAGGFGILADYGEYPWSVEQYHEWLEENSEKFEWATAMDFACEDDLDHVGTVEERIERTIENTVKQWHMDRSYKLLPVLQGQTVDEYVYSCRKLQENGVDVSHVGLGSVCQRSSQKEITRIVTEVRERCPEIDKIHGFGAKLNTIRLEADFDTMDSAAWTECPMHGKTLRPKTEDDVWVGAVQDDRRDDTARKSFCMSFETYYAQATWRMHGEPEITAEEIRERWS
jgi:queuine/archaeosine tRNA-ribosyltransferase